MNEKHNDGIHDARTLGVPKMLILGLQHLFAMFGATILVPILVGGYFSAACGEELTRGLTISVTLFCAGTGTLLFHLCSKFKVPAFLGSSFAFLGGFYTVANLNMGIYAGMSANDKAAYACGGIVIAGCLYFILAFIIKLVGVQTCYAFPAAGRYRSDHHLHRSRPCFIRYFKCFHKLAISTDRTDRYHHLQYLGQGYV